MQSQKDALSVPSRHYFRFLKRKHQRLAAMDEALEDRRLELTLARLRYPL
jgi:hypothetical protein